LGSGMGPGGPSSNGGAVQIGTGGQRDQNDTQGGGPKRQWAPREPMEKPSGPGRSFGGGLDRGLVTSKGGRVQRAYINPPKTQKNGSCKRHL